MITGPTASGKSGLVADLARTRPITVVSADSRQVYRGFDIGTAKPSREEQATVPHAMIDVADPRERWNAARWADDATVAIEAALASGRQPVVVGGTGLYLKALFAPLFNEPGLDPSRRAALAAELEGVPTEVLRSRVAVVDPPRAHLGRTQLLRALEVAALTGRPISEWHATAPRFPRFEASYLVVQRADLATQIERRIDAMWLMGWAEEVCGLIQTVPEDAPAWNATGYDVMREFVRGTHDAGAARQQILISTRQYAKRQRTWFRHQLGDQVHHVDLTDPAARSRVEDWWQSVSQCA